MLTDAWLKANHRKPREKTTEKADRDGLSARVTRTGKVVFQLRFRHLGRASRMDLGSYPTMGIAKARKEAEKRRGQLELGLDPRLQKRLEQESVTEAHTNESLIRLWHERYSTKNKVGADEILRSFELYVFPEIGDIPAGSTSLAIWMDLLEPLAEKVPSIADRLLANIKQAHKWAARRELIRDQPLASISARLDLQARRGTRGRALTEDEVRLVWRAMDRTRMALRSKLFIKLCLFWGCRPGELRLARVEEFDFEEGVWEVPPERHKVGEKTGRPLRRPIIAEVAPWLREAMALSHDRGRLFSGEQSSAELNDRSVGSFPYSVMTAAKRHLGVTMEHWSMYDLRKTARTHWSKLAPPHVCELMLGHGLPPIWGIYDHYDYLDEQRKAYQAWWERLTEMLGRPPIA